ncbi:MAG: EF-hand domain-containing protein [Alphaproteobacteria bacterium]
MTIHGIGHGHGHHFHGLGRHSFGRADGDDDGKLSREELETAGQDLPGGKKRLARLEARFDKIDSDGDGALTRTEIRDGIRADMRDLLLRSQEARDTRRAERLMDKADGDDDGLLSADELDAFAENVRPGSRMAARVELLQRFFDAADGDENGGLSTREIAGFLGEVRQAYGDFVDGLRADDAFGQFLAERFGPKATTDEDGAAPDSTVTTTTTTVTTTTEPASEPDETTAPAPIPFHGKRYGFFGERGDLLLRYFDQADGDDDGGLTKDEINGFFKELKGAFRDFVSGLREQDAFGQFLDARFAAPAESDEAPEEAGDDGEITTTVTTTTTTTTTTVTTG